MGRETGSAFLLSRKTGMRWHVSSANSLVLLTMQSQTESSSTQRWGSLFSPPRSALLIGRPPPHNHSHTREASLPGANCAPHIKPEAWPQMCPPPSFPSPVGAEQRISPLQGSYGFSSYAGGDARDWYEVPLWGTGAVSFRSKRSFWMLEAYGLGLCLRALLPTFFF